ncbi:MAG: hypothetical protein AAF938_25815 [Myxococcota bacterium]
MHAEEVARYPLAGTDSLRISPSTTGGLILLEGTRCTALDSQLLKTAAFDIAPPGHDLTLIALEAGVLIGTEEGLSLYSFDGRETATLPFDPWGAGLRGAVAYFDDAIWSVHFPTGPTDLELPWTLTRLRPDSLAITHQASLSQVDALELELFDTGDARVGIDLFNPPDYVGTLHATFKDGRLNVSDAVTRKEEHGDLRGRAYGRLVARTAYELLIAERTGETLARSPLVDVFGADESGGSRDDLLYALPGPRRTFLGFTTNGHFGVLRMTGDAVRFERIVLADVQTRRARHQLSNLATGFTGLVTREATNLTCVVPWGDRYITVHSDEHVGVDGIATDTEFRVWKLVT